MAAGVNDKLWSVEDIAQLVEDYEQRKRKSKKLKLAK